MHYTLSDVSMDRMRQASIRRILNREALERRTQTLPPPTRILPIADVETSVHWYVPVDIHGDVVEVGEELPDHFECVCPLGRQCKIKLPINDRRKEPR